MRFTVDAIAGLAFGNDVNTLESDDDVIQQPPGQDLAGAVHAHVAPCPTGACSSCRPTASSSAAWRPINAAVDGFIAAGAPAAARRSGAARAAPRNLLEAMLVAADEPDSGIDDAQVAGNVLTMLLAGEDTTANTLAWCI